MRVWLVWGAALVLLVGTTFGAETPSSKEVHQLGEADLAKPALTKQTVQEAAESAAKATQAATEKAVDLAQEDAANAAANAARKVVKQATAGMARAAKDATLQAVQDATDAAMTAPAKAKQNQIDQAVQVAVAAAKSQLRKEVVTEIAAKQKAEAAAQKASNTEQGLVHEFSRGAPQTQSTANALENQASFEDALDSEVNALKLKAHVRPDDTASPGLITDAYKMGFQHGRGKMDVKEFSQALSKMRNQNAEAAESKQTKPEEAKPDEAEAKPDEQKPEPTKTETSTEAKPEKPAKQSGKPKNLTVEIPDLKLSEGSKEQVKAALDTMWGTLP